MSTTTNIWSWQNWTTIIAKRYTNRSGKTFKSKIYIYPDFSIKFKLIDDKSFNKLN